jgi:predicted ribosomally synthesized peptide with SipW-like signal peptide
MNDTDDDGGLGRREVLAAVAGAGGLGLAGGVGTAALLGDSESFDGMFQSGSLNLEVVDKDETESQVDGDTLELNLDLESSREGSEVLKLWAPPGDGNNPAYVWFQPTCPDPVTRLAEQLEVAFYYADSDGDRLEDDNGDEPIESGSLTDVANALRKEGALLDLGEDDSCLAPGSPAYLRVEWDLADSYSAGEKLDFSIVFRARQCRNNSGAESPFNRFDPCDRATPTPTETPPTGKNAISNIGFCTDSSGDINPRITQINNQDQDNPTSVDWETDLEVDFVTLFFGYPGGPRITIYDYRDEERKSGTATRNDPDAAVSLYDPGKTGRGKGANGAPSRLCEIADQQLDTDDSYSNEEKAKLEFEDGEFKSEGEGEND